MAQRLSDTQEVASAIDNVIPIVRRLFGRDGTDEHERRALHYLSVVSHKALQVAEQADVADSIRRVGINERNLRRIRDMSATPAAELPELFELPAALPPSAA